MSSPAFNPQRLWHTAKTTKRFWVPLFVLVIVAVNAAMFFMPKKYQSSALVLINKPKLEMMTGQIGSVLDIRQYLDTIRENMTSFSFLDNVARKLNLGKGLNTESPQYQAMIDNMRRNIDLYVKNEVLFTVAFKADTPEKARDVTNEIVNQYIAASSSGAEKRTGDIKKLIASELVRSEAQLREAQDKIKNYKESNPNEIPDAQQQNLQRLNELRNLKQQTEGNLQGYQVALGMQQNELKNTSATIVSQVTTLQENAQLATLKQNKQNLETSLKMLLQDFTEKHLKVKETRLALKQIDDQIAGMKATPRGIL